MVRGKKAAPSHKGETPKPIAQPYQWPAPIRGWVLDESLAAPVAGGAILLDNFICTTTGVRVRGGCEKHATLPAAVKSMFTYKSASTEIIFAATDANIYNVSAPASPDVSPASSVSGITSGDYSAEQFGTAGGDFLMCVNGADTARLFNGTSWAFDTITGVASADLSHVWGYANRLFFVEKDTLRFWYLDVDSIGGAATSFSLAGVFTKGGSLLFGATWSMDAGDGLDDKCVFVSTEGEVAVYEGVNPSSVTDWRKVGVYQITKPLGKNATMQAGGDLLIATEVGLVPISAAINTDEAALEINSVSDTITPYWQSQVIRTNAPWEIIKWPQKNILIVSQPDATDKSCLVANLQTKAWSRVTGWETDCLGFYDGNGYFGSSNGLVYKMDATGSDDGLAYSCVFVSQHDSMGAMGMEKTVHQARPIFRANIEINPLISVQADYSSRFLPPPSAPPDTAPVTARYSGGQWTSIGRTGSTMALEVQLTFQNVETPDVELAVIDATYTIGALVA